MQRGLTMSLKRTPIQPVPDQTHRVARAAFPKGNPYLTLRDRLGTIFADDDFADLFPGCGQPSEPPWRLALVTIMQFREHLADRQAAEAVRARIDFPRGGFSPPEGRLARGYKPPAFSRFLFQSAVQSAESF
jgi:hypothetical protein